MTRAISDAELLSQSSYQLAREHGIPRSTIYDWQVQARLVHKTADEIEEAARPAEYEDDADEFLAQVAGMADALLAQRNQTQFLEVHIETTIPIGLAFTGDWHFGAVGTDYRRLYNDIESLAQAPGVYVVGMGDYGDNYKAGLGRVSAGLYDAVVPNPDAQQRGWSRLLERLNPRLLGLILGCHLDWDFDKAGRDALQPVVEKLGRNELGQPVANLGYGGVLRLAVGGQHYTALARHRIKADGGINTTNAHRRASDEYPVDTPWDIIALAHLHYNDLHQPTHAGRQQVWLRSGGYKIVDRYGQKLAGYSGEPGVPIVVLFPDRHEMLPFRGDQMHIALGILDAARKGTIKL